jgi:hypothetical protein
MQTSENSTVLTKTALAFILAVGAALRLYQLETPSLWWDEILVPLTASHSMSYIFDFCRSAEMHPPLFYIISKASLAAGVSDFSLRFLPVVLGIGSIYILYRIVRVFSDEGTALIASAVTSISGLHILLSREIRPYALQLVLVLWALWLLVKITQSGRWKDIALLAVVNAALFWLHYFTFHIVFAQGVILVLCLFARRPGFDLKRFLVFCLTTALAAWPVFFWFFLPSSGSQSIFADTQYSRWTVFDLIVNYLGLAAFFFEPVWIKLAATGLALAGFSILAVRRTWLALICLVFVIAPLANVLALGKAAYFSPWHVAYVTPFLAFFIATALAVLPWRKTIALAIVASGAVLIITKEHARFYEVDSYRHNVFVTLYKPMAKHLVTALPSGGVTVCSNPGFANGVSWYLDQYVRPNPLRTQQVTPDEKKVMVRFISAFRDFGTLGGDEAAFLAKQGAPEAVEDALNAKVYTFKYDHHPVVSMATFPFEGTIEAGLGFFSRVHSLKDLTYCPMPGVGITATRNDSPGSFEFVLENETGENPLSFFVNLHYLNSGVKNLLGLFYRFDDEPRVPLAGTIGPDPKRQLQAMFNRDKPFKRLTFTVELNCQDLSAQYHGGNLETLAFRKLEVFACAVPGAKACQAVWERRNMESMRLNFTSESFAVKGGVRQRPLWENAKNLQDDPAPEAKGWRVLTPKDSSEPGVVIVELTPGKDMVFYPRLSGSANSVQVFEIMPDGSDRPVFLMAGVPEEWSPISAQYPLILPDGPANRTLRVELRGRFCQLWYKDGEIFF